MSHLDIHPSPQVARAARPVAADAPTVLPPPKRAPAARAEAPKAEMHITCQFRHGRAMVYDLKAGQRRFEMRIQATAPGAWGVAMLVKESVEKAPVDAVGTTRLLAFDALQQGCRDMLANEDWAGIRKALTEVRAL